jgi:SAM-dependent methyltransferase
MKSSYSLNGKIEDKYQILLYHDKLTIDNPDKYWPSRINYYDWFNTVIHIIKSTFPIPHKIKIGDFACAQANLGLLLGEMGYHVFCIDINPLFIEYSKIKYEKGNVRDITKLDFPSNSLDVAIVTEFIEHCAYPEDVIKKIMNYVRPEGILIVTTPNGSRLKTKVLSFKQVKNRELRAAFIDKQFGPDGKDHLFLFSLDDLRYIVPYNSKIIQSGYTGGTLLINKYTYKFYKLFPIKFIEFAVRLLSKTPILNKKTFNGIYAVLKKGRSSKN